MKIAKTKFYLEHLKGREHGTDRHVGGSILLK
jgi:hypothetical protein